MKLIKLCMQFYFHYNNIDKEKNSYRVIKPTLKLTSLLLECRKIPFSLNTNSFDTEDKLVEPKRQFLK